MLPGYRKAMHTSTAEVRMRRAGVPIVLVHARSQFALGMGTADAQRS
jgi:hypothetical protein